MPKNLTFLKCKKTFSESKVDGLMVTLAVVFAPSVNIWLESPEPGVNKLGLFMGTVYF
jgi:hypothetical protein